MKFLSQLTPREFEELCYQLLAFGGLKNLEWHGQGGGDRGRDIVGTKTESPLDGLEASRKWLVQCRHMARESVSKAAIQEWLAACREHGPDDVLLVVSSGLTSAMKDWLRALRPDYRFSIHLWEEPDIRRQVEKHASRLQKLFPQLEGVAGVVEFYEMKGFERTVACNEFEEAFITVWNATSRREALERAQEFVEFIKSHDIRFVE